VLEFFGDGAQAHGAEIAGAALDAVGGTGKRRLIASREGGAEFLDPLRCILDEDTNDFLKEGIIALGSKGAEVVDGFRIEDRGVGRAGVGEWAGGVGDERAFYGSRGGGRGLFRWRGVGRARGGYGEAWPLGSSNLKAHPPLGAFSASM